MHWWVIDFPFPAPSITNSKGDFRMRPFMRNTCSRKILPLIVAFASIATSTYSQADEASQNQLKQLSLEQLGSIEVTTKSKSPEEVRNTAAAIYVITQEEIRRSGATSIPEALRLAPGVEVARIDGNKWSIGIRGFGSRLARSVLVLIDGRSVYTTLLAGTYWEVQDTLMEDIDRIEVIRGPGGTVWGPNAVNGVINVITKSSMETQGSLVSTGGGNIEQGFVSARFGGSNTKGFSYRVYGKEFNRSSEYTPDRENYDRWYAAQGGFRTDWKKNDRDSVTLQGDIYDERAGEQVQLVNYTSPFSRIVDHDAVLSGGNILGRFTRSFREGEDIQLQFYYDRTNRYESNFGDLRNTFDIDYLQRSYLGLRNHLTWGLGARASQGHELNPTTGLYFDPSHRTDELYTTFVQDEVSLVPDRLNLEIGTKLVLTNYTGVEAEPSGRLLWTPTSNQTVWLAATRAVRTPSDGEDDFFLTGFLGVSPTGVPFFARFNANRDFKSEKLDGYELGYRGLMGRTAYLDIAGFYNQYYDLFSEELAGPTFVETNPAPTHLLLPAQFRNGLLGTTTGGEIAPEWRPTNFWRLRGSYSFLHMALKKSATSADVGTASTVAGSSPQHQVLMQSSFDLPKSVTFDFDFRYVSALRGLSIPAYSSGDARIAWTFRRHLEFSAVGRNILQPNHVEFASDTGPNVAIKRSFYGQLVWTSKEN
jgi:iron complex outermembrane receptor protein